MTHDSPNRSRKHGEDGEFGELFVELNKLHLYYLCRERSRLIELRRNGRFLVADNMRLRVVLAVIKQRDIENPIR